VHAVVVFGVLLGPEDLSVLAIPGACPVLVGPAQAEGKIGLSRAQNFFKWALQETRATKPVVVITKARDSVRLGELGLSLSRLGYAKIVETEVRWQMWLIMILE
jgi:hypothetical protein